MGSFRSAATRRAQDQDVFTDGLAEGESITYWKRLPHSAAERIANEATEVALDRKGRPLGARVLAGRAARIRLEEGIVDWVIFDENGDKVEWDRKRAADLIDGLPPKVINALAERIGGDEPEGLNEPADPDTPEGETVGEDSAGS